MCFSQTRKTTIYCKLHFPKLAKKIVLIPNVLIECCIDHSEHEVYSCYSQMWWIKYHKKETTQLMRLVQNILVIPHPHPRWKMHFWSPAPSQKKHGYHPADVLKWQRRDQRQSEKVSWASTLPVHSHFPLLPRILMSVKKYSDDTLAPTQPAAFLCADVG